ncbi:MAG: hypothetical protein FWD17_04040, partial [Polyangiaceae bacterium]|nr:hypothetical protein [Polyangiaceae bacterium]
MVEHRPRGVSRQVEVAVVCEIHDRVAIGRRRVVDGERVVGQRVDDGDFEVARIAAVAVGARVRELEVQGFGLGDGPGVPEDLVEPLGAAVQMVRGLVGLDRDWLPAEGKGA